MSEKEKTQTTEANRPNTPAVTIPGQLPILPLSDVVMFPHLVAPLLVTSAQSIRLVDDVVAGDRLVGVTLQKDPDVEHPSAEHLHEYGCVARVLRMLKFPDESVRVLIQGLERMKILKIQSETPYLVAQIEPVRDVVEPGLELAALARNAGSQFQQVVDLSPSLPDELKVASQNIEDPGKLSDIIAANLNLTLEEKQDLLETPDVRVRLSLLATLLNREQEVLHLGSEIQNKVTKAISKTQREYFLREQLKTIQKELGEGGEQGGEVGEFRDKIEAAKMPAEVKKIALKELDRLGQARLAEAIRDHLTQTLLAEHLVHVAHLLEQVVDRKHQLDLNLVVAGLGDGDMKLGITLGKAFV
jgi:ATP-dependent Lon protease